MSKSKPCNQSSVYLQSQSGQEFDCIYPFFLSSTFKPFCQLRFSFEFFKNVTRNVTGEKLLNQSWYEKFVRKMFLKLTPQLTTTSIKNDHHYGVDRSFILYNVKLPMTNNHLSTTAINFGRRKWSWYTDLNVFKKVSF